MVGDLSASVHGSPLAGGELRRGRELGGAKGLKGERRKDTPSEVLWTSQIRILFWDPE